MSENISSRRRKAETPEQRRLKKIIQIAAGVVVFAVIIFLANKAQEVNPKGAFIIMVGTAFGYILQRSRFCFTASLRDPSLTGGTDLTKAVIIGLAVSSLLFMGLDFAKLGFGIDNIDFKGIAGYVRPVGVHTAVGGFLFGLGAVLAGGCASGTVMRIGEGFLQQWLALVFFIIGSMVGIWAFDVFKAYPLLYSGKAVFLPQAFGGWTSAIIFQFGLFFVLYILADWWGKKKAGAVK